MRLRKLLPLWVCSARSSAALLLFGHIDSATLGLAAWREEEISHGSAGK